MALRKLLRVMLENRGKSLLLHCSNKIKQIILNTTAITKLFQKDFIARFTPLVFVINPCTAPMMKAPMRNIG